MSSIQKIELNTKAVGELLNSKEVADYVEKTARTVKSNYGKGAWVKMSNSFGRPRAFINAHFKDASKNNKLLKAFHK